MIKSQKVEKMADRNSPEFLERLTRYRNHVTNTATQFYEPSQFIGALQTQLADERTIVKKSREGINVQINMHTILQISKTGVKIRENRADGNGKTQALEKITPELAKQAYEMAKKRLFSHGKFIDPIKKTLGNFFPKTNGKSER